MPVRVQYAQRKYLILLVAALALLIVDPAVEGYAIKTHLHNILYSLMLASVLLATFAGRTQKLVACGLGLPAIVVAWITYLSLEPERNLAEYTALLGIVFVGWAAVVILIDVITQKTVGPDTILGAFCAYLLIGFMWAKIYLLVEMLCPQSFYLNPAILELQTSKKLDESLFDYYSFVTLSTLGYGDLTPVTPMARTFAWLEAVIGQFYLAVFVARIVGLKISQTGNGGDEGRSEPGT